VFALFRSVTPLVEPLSLDEAYLDVTENAWQETLGVSVARRLKGQILEETGLTASAGVAPNKFLAKIASGWKKPDGLTVIAPGRVERFLHELPIEALWGVGPVTARKLRAIGIVRLVDVRAIDGKVLTQTVGSQAEWLRQLSHGIDDRPVVTDRVRKSCGTENTFPKDLVDRDEIRLHLDSMARENAEWLRKNGLLARTVTVKVRYSDFSTVTRSHTGEVPTNEAADISRRALELADRTEAGRQPVRLLGVSVHNLVDPESKDTTDETSTLPFSDC
jgi:DNA polymerase-4